MAEEFWAQEILFIYKSLLENLSKHWPRRKHYFGCCLVANSCLTLCNSVDYSPPGSSVHGISQARILESVAISFSKGSSRLRDWTRISCIAEDSLSSEPSEKSNGGVKGKWFSDYSKAFFWDSQRNLMGRTGLWSKQLKLVGTSIFVIWV